MATWRTEECLPARFRLVRREDRSGVSGVGIVAHGVWLPNGMVGLGWNSRTPSLSTFTHVDDLVEVHGHDGATLVDWIDPEPTASRQAISSAVVRLP